MLFVKLNFKCTIRKYCVVESIKMFRIDDVRHHLYDVRNAHVGSRVLISYRKSPVVVYTDLWSNLNHGT